jgi:hypothetical protein
VLVPYAAIAPAAIASGTANTIMVSATVIPAVASGLGDYSVSCANTTSGVFRPNTLVYNSKTTFNSPLLLGASRAGSHAA